MNVETGIKLLATREKAKKTGFTLIELLVVIAIIGILVGLLMPAVATARRYAIVVKARSEVKQLETGIRTYYAEYQRWPGGLSGKFGEGKMVDGSLAKILQGTVSTNNPKGIAFMRFDPKRLTPSYGPVSPWGTTNSTPTTYKEHFYWAKVDDDYDNVIAKGNTALTPPEGPDKDVRMPVIVWTYNTKEKGGDKYVVGSWK